MKNISYLQLFLQLLIIVMLLTSFTDKISNDPQPIKPAEILEVQKQWGDGIIAIANAYQTKKDYKAIANKLLNDLYAFHETDVLFKPTLASEVPFRMKRPEAFSYFIGGEIAEDKGFAIIPWNKIVFQNYAISIDKNRATAMGNYYFTNAINQTVTQVEYTFGYYKDASGKLLIHLHHSSLPFKPE